MPALSACTSSPVPGTSVTIDTSAVRTMSTSSWPTPTVSMMTMSLPAASSTSAASPVARASPPRWPRVAMLRMNTPASPACACIRTRSPRTAPPVNGLVGSTAIDADRLRRRRANLGDQAIDQRALAGAGRTGDADQIGAAGAARRCARISSAPAGALVLDRARSRARSRAGRPRARARPDGVGTASITGRAAGAR